MSTHLYKSTTPRRARQRTPSRWVKPVAACLALLFVAWPAYGFSTGYQKVLWVKVIDTGVWVRLDGYDSPDSLCSSPLDFIVRESEPLFEIKAAVLLSAVLADKQVSLLASTCSGTGTLDGMNVVTRITLKP